MFKLYDISMTIRENMQVWNNKDTKKPSFENTANHEIGQTYETRISMDAHTGTHLDAPLHMLKGGDTIDKIPLDHLIGPARVLDLTRVEGSIGREHLEPFAIRENEWILLKTRSSFSEEFDFDFVFVNMEGARYLAELKIRGVGTDALGIERAQPDYSTHRTLMSNNVLILEGLRLKDVPAGPYWFVLAPLKLEGIEAAPARAFLLGS
ncbi:cyclase family protein [Paenibacillus hamazuiensis]|uniref:cyclase family protein n=1 Tax=Paenibacillus hamazuiensis TaxID=2936508 RepID=UPI00200EC3E6|nr:cyclase family protein [Paenibacillus hamazuiensis]